MWFVASGSLWINRETSSTNKGTLNKRDTYWYNRSNTGTWLCYSLENIRHWSCDGQERPWKLSGPEVWGLSLGSARSPTSMRLPGGLVQQVVANPSQIILELLYFNQSVPSVSPNFIPTHLCGDTYVESLSVYLPSCVTVWVHTSSSTDGFAETYQVSWPPCTLHLHSLFSHQFSAWATPPLASQPSAWSLPSPPEFLWAAVSMP